MAALRCGNLTSTALRHQANTAGGAMKFVLPQNPMKQKSDVQMNLHSHVASLCSVTIWPQAMAIGGDNQFRLGCFLQNSVSLIVSFAGTRLPHPRTARPAFFDLSFRFPGSPPPGCGFPHSVMILF